MSSSHRGRASSSHHSLHDSTLPPADPSSSSSSSSSDATSPLSSFPTIDRALFESRKVLPDPPAPSTLRFLISTDNHLGFAEHDPIRRDDSFLTFEEVLVVAELHCVDFLLLGGDLFHENKPSRPCLLRALQLLRRHVLGARPVTFEVVSDGRRNFPATGRVNYEEADLNVAIPVFAIHGNHDDPAGLGQLSALDLLHEARLINYWGKAERVDHIVNYPLLLRKGPDDDTRLALYGLGNVRDERLHRTFAANGVKWVRPEGDDEWFNVAVIHQNRVVHTAHGKDFISCKMLPDFLDMVVWGHEHECLMDQVTEEGEFVVLQPGSSVATSLSQGEAVDKHLALVEVQGDKFRLLQVPLYTTRPFVIDDVTLSEEVDAQDANPAVAVEDLLTQKIHDVLDRIKKEPKFANPDRPKLPLVRLRVEHTGFARLNVSKFGQRFVGKVANPDDLLLFYKQKLTAPRGSSRAGAGGGVSARDLDLSSLHAKRDVDEAPPISDIVAQLIARTPLTVLNELGLASAIEEFVDKKNLDSIPDFVKRDLRSVQSEMRGEKEVMQKGGGLRPEEIEREVKRRHDVQREKEGPRRVIRAKKEGGARGAGGGEDRDVLEGLDVGQLNLLGISRDGGGTDDDDYGEEKEEKQGVRGSRGGSRASAARAGGRGRGRGRGGGKATTSRRAKAEPEEEEEAEAEARDFDADEDGRREGGGVDGGDFDEDEGENDWGPPAHSAQPRVRGEGGRRSVVEEEAEDPEATLDDEAPVAKRSRVKAEPVVMGSRNRAGELSFLTGTGKGRGGGARGKKPTQSSAAPASRRVGGAAPAAARGRSGASHVVDLSEDVED